MTISTKPRGRTGPGGEGEGEATPEIVASAAVGPSPAPGIVEADETFVLESFKGKRKDLPRPPRQRGGKVSKRGLSAEQIPVIVARDRTGATLDAVLPRLDAVSIMAALGGAIAPSTDFCCDGGSAIPRSRDALDSNLRVLPGPRNPKPEAPEHHINGVNLTVVSIFSTKDMRFGLRSDSSRFCPCRYQATVGQGF